MNNKELTQEKDLSEMDVDYSKIVDTKYKEICKNCFPIINTLIMTGINSFKSSVDITVDDLKDYIDLKPDDNDLELQNVSYVEKLVSVFRYLARCYSKKKGLSVSLSVSDTSMRISWVY